ncbi:hypothetical protein F511_37458 [Dorcoceras hygrometricum]|uniref:Uncharacterized protein n=1 Tax=Dorcoceras hygrometricum TaxID=472368 RepID=A0A2Z7CCH9_9LAMI|nr:hypothetical protein F511_37458 [Dorcoceras hygrometricum]
MGKKAVKQNPEKGSMEKMSRRSKNKKNYGKGEQQRMRISDSPFCKWINMQALVYESIPTLGVRRSLNVYPRLFRWGKSRILLKNDEADTLLNRVDITQVLPIQPFNEVENLVDLKRVERSEDGMSESFVDVDEASNSRGEEELDEFRGRSDFIGHEKSDEDRKLVIEFLGIKKFDVIVLEDEHIRFLAGFLRHLSRFNLASQDLVRERCRQQGATLGCGVYSCMWLNCLAYDTPEIWECEQKDDVNAY